MDTHLPTPGVSGSQTGGYVGPDVSGECPLIINTHRAWSSRTRQGAAQRGSDVFPVKGTAPRPHDLQAADCSRSVRLIPRLVLLPDSDTHPHRQNDVGVSGMRNVNEVQLGKRPKPSDRW